jgi:hypothetical protein
MLRQKNEPTQKRSRLINGLLIVGFLGLGTSIFAYLEAYACAYSQIDYVLSPKELKDPVKRKMVLQVAEQEMLQIERPFIVVGGPIAAVSFLLFVGLVLTGVWSSRQVGSTDSGSGTGMMGGSAPSAVRMRKTT